MRRRQFKVRPRGVSPVAAPPFERRLAAILAADVVGYSRLDENADFKRIWESLQAFRTDYQIWKDLGCLE